MFDREPFQSERVPSLYLDYGVDAQLCEDGGIEVSERGMRLCSRWRFDIGTQILVCCVFEHPRLGSQRVAVEGIVVWCEPKASNSYESTLLFLELPDDLKQGLREFSFQLSAA
jgi:PilZ domain-containing protein